MNRKFLINRSVIGRREEEPTRDALRFHRRLPGYEATRLMAADDVARRLGVAQALVKVESQRFGLPAFKILGASWAIYRVLEEKAGGFAPWESFDALIELARSKLGGVSFTAATDGNHGRAVARLANLFGFGATIFVPKGTAKARIDAIEGEGATCVVIDGTYDDAVNEAQALASDDCLLIADTDPEGKDPVPNWVVEGYSTIFWELEEQLVAQRMNAPDVVVIQIGVGALAQSAVAHFRRPSADRPPKMVSVEPIGAACALQSATAGRPVLVPGPHTSVMAGLNCGLPSTTAWPTVSTGFDVFVAIGDEYVPGALRSLAHDGIEAGETGAAGVAGLLALANGAKGAEAVDERLIAEVREAAGLGADSRVLFICTEGVTDPESYEAMLAAAD